MTRHATSYQGIVNTLNTDSTVNCVDRNDFFSCSLTVVDVTDLNKSFHCHLNTDCLKRLENVMKGTCQRNN